MREVLVIGAGPAGLAAARAARDAGASVVLLDSSDALGGQFWRHLPSTRPSRNEKLLHHGWSRFHRLSDALESDARVRILPSAQVWAIEVLDGVAVHAIIGEPDGRQRERRVFRPDALVLATGAHDRTLPFPGWDLPGVFTGGAAQALAKGERLAVGERVLVAGAGPFLLPVAQSLTLAGSRVLAVLEANHAARLIRGWSPRPWQLLGAAGKGVELAGYVAGQVRHRIPYRLGRAVIAAHGTDRVESVTTARLDAHWAPVAGTEETVEVDAICVSHGFTPRIELAIAAGCALTRERFVVVDEHQRTSIDGVYAAGEITGIGGADLALAEGEIAGFSAAGGTSRSGPARSGPARRRRIFTGVANRIEVAHGIQPGWTEWLDDATVICRCEEVDCGSLRTVARSTQSESFRALKLSSRAGLGICQGRMCGRTVEHLLCTFSENVPLKDDAHSDRRPIALPLRLSELAEPTSHKDQRKGNHD